MTFTRLNGIFGRWVGQHGDVTSHTTATPRTWHAITRHGGMAKLASMTTHTITSPQYAWRHQLSHYHIITLSRCHTNCHVVTLSHYYAVTLSHYHTITSKIESSTDHDVVIITAVMSHIHQLPRPRSSSCRAQCCVGTITIWRC